MAPPGTITTITMITFTMTITSTQVYVGEDDDKLSDVVINRQVE